MLTALIIPVIIGMLIPATLSSCGGDGDGEVQITEISLNETTLNMKIGETYKLSVKYTPSNASTKFEWTSSNPSVATVSEGMVSAIAGGSTLITVKTIDGTITAKCMVNVSYKEPESISLTPKTISLITGETMELTTQVYPVDAYDKSVLWGSSNDKIATVNDKGNVTALTPGICWIYAKTKIGGFLDSCSVAVSKRPVEKVMLNEHEIEIYEDKTFTLAATIFPQNATYQSVIWYSANENVATVDRGVVKGVLKGETYIKVITEDEEKVDSCLVKVLSTNKINYTPYGNEEEW